MTRAIDDLKLPASLVKRSDLARVVREVETVDSDIASQKVRGGPKAQIHIPTMSQALSDFLDLNKLDIKDNQARMGLKEQLRALKDKAPIVHMTFATAADPASLEQLVTWLRANAHPQALLSIGLQPSLVGGVYLRTPNRAHDYSMRALMQDKRDIVVRQLEELC